MSQNGSASIIDEICSRALTLAPEIPWLVEPLTPGRGRAFIPGTFLSQCVGRYLRHNQTMVLNP